MTVIFKTACGATKTEEWPSSQVKPVWVVPLMRRFSAFGIGANDPTGHEPPPFLERRFELRSRTDRIALYEEVL